ncbi:hypothetical protein [Colwellia sp. RSH04]|uniref:hypothetical protein n=1 Tax=Colwellia sp. RSH04 TaxID=2305464 RepID=UPI000E58773D|nr:hypothetical protein [Colwellia sp. RSH04]RHW77637.1 hypothetical protein D1094_01445 [Colwellia sp. RSH04]
MINKIALVLVLLATSSCAQNKGTVAKINQAVTNTNIGVCKDPRPQMCTMEYLPVCGLISNKAVKTYGNACGACSDIHVTQYVKGECENDALERFLDGSIGDALPKKSTH